MMFLCFERYPAGMFGFWNGLKVLVTTVIRSGSPICIER